LSIITVKFTRGINRGDEYRFLPVSPKPYTCLIKIKFFIQLPMEKLIQIYTIVANEEHTINLLAHKGCRPLHSLQ
jgi:hypothetical protein